MSMKGTGLYELSAKVHADRVAEALAKVADEDVSKVPQWLTYLAEAIESEVGPGWLFDMETLIRERRERGGW